MPERSVAFIGAFQVEVFAVEDNVNEASEPAIRFHEPVTGRTMDRQLSQLLLDIGGFQVNIALKAQHGMEFRWTSHSKEHRHGASPFVTLANFRTA
jgi:hypothetical protein